MKSYTGYFDVFSETIQNALDATEAKLRAVGKSYEPKIWIEIDIENCRVRVTDNGIGISADEFKYFLKPNISFKKPKDFRGQEGVGATFLAYGFSLLRVHTRQGGNEVAAILRQGRQWAQDQNETVPRPAFQQEKFNVSELSAEESGTSVEIVLSGASGERPKKLDWLGAKTAEQWLDVLRIKTPLGGIYLKTPKFAPKIFLKVVDSTGEITRTETVQPEYFYPHEMPSIKVATVKDVESALTKIQGDPEQKFSRLDGQFKRLDCLWEIYDKNDLNDTKSWFATALDDEQRALIEKHDVVVYSSFLRSARMWGDLNENIFKLKPGERIIQGGRQMASDYMVQGDLSIIPLTSTIGYQANSHVIVHFTDGNPDISRKVFQPELKQLAEVIAVRCVTIFKRYLTHLKPDFGAQVVAPDKQLYDWKKDQELYRDQNTLAFKTDAGRVTLLSRPQQVQDVIALFHQLVGLGLIRGIDFLATSQSDRYDSLYILDYSDEGFQYNKTTNPLGVCGPYGFPHISEPRVLEYKFDLDALIRDFSSEVKYAKHVNFVVCWKAEKQFREKYYLSSLLVGDEGSSRQVYGATHQAFPDGGGQQPDFEVCILEDLLAFLQDPEAEEARQKLWYQE
ncbi:MAG: ATP-binding protein [Sphingomicrobium sp.]